MNGRLVLVVVVGALLFGAAAVTSMTAIGNKQPPAVMKQLQSAKAATDKYRNVARAEADGYRTVPGPDGQPVCVASPAGGMGIHYENERLMANNALKITQPEILVYAPQPDGSLQLVALEWLKADSDQDPSTTTDLPRLFRTPFDGPHEGHHPGMPIHYDLHAWLFQANRAGMFTQFNPAVRC
jgi:hypothetical protein